MRFDLVGSGGLYSNIEDMYLWDQNFYSNKLGNGDQALINKMHEEGLLNNGENTKYALGLSNGEYRGLKTVSHGGSLAGYRTFFLRFPEQETSIVILANIGNFNSGGKAREVADVILRDHLRDKELESGDKKSTDIKYKNVSLKKLNSYTGTYIIEPGVNLEFSIKYDSLYASQKWNNIEYSVAGIDDETFIIPGNLNLKFKFGKISDSKAHELSIDQRGDITICERRGELAEVVELENFTGTYYSEELNVSYEIYVEENTLKSRIGYNEPANLSLSNNDQFTVDGAVLNFNRSDNGVTSFVVDAGRVRGIEFVKTSE
jgi:hypothetical protein